MNAYATPAAAGPSSGPFAPDRRDWLRLLGGMMFAAGALVLVFRKDGDWSDWALLLVFVAPCVVLYAMAFAGRRSAGGLQGWQSAFLAFAVILLPLALLQFLEAIDGSTGDELNIAWIFGLSAAVAAVTALATGARWQMLIAGLYAGVAWIALWSKVLDDLSEDRLRTIVAVFGVLLLLLAVLSGRARRPFTSDLVTVAGIALVVVGVIHLAGLANDAIDLEGVLPDEARPEQGWNIYLLVVSLLLIAYGARSLTRGPAYIGAIGLLVFVGVVGQDVVAAFNAEEGRGVVGWPLILLIGGALLAAASFFLPRSGSGPTTAPHDSAPVSPAPVSQAPAAVAGEPAAPPPPRPAGGGGGLLDQWRTPPPGGGQPPQQ